MEHNVVNHGQRVVGHVALLLLLQETRARCFLLGEHLELGPATRVRALQVAADVVDAEGAEELGGRERAAAALLAVRRSRRRALVSRQQLLVLTFAPERLAEPAHGEHHVARRVVLLDGDEPELGLVLLLPVVAARALRGRDVAGGAAVDVAAAATVAAGVLVVLVVVLQLTLAAAVRVHEELLLVARHFSFSSEMQ